MTERILVPQANEVACNTTPNTFSTSTSTSAVGLVRVVNISTAPLVLTISSNSSVNVSSMTILGNTEIFVEKPVTWLLQSSAVGSTNCLAVPVAYKS
jgi:hypothetical protein